MPLPFKRNSPLEGLADVEAVLRELRPELPDERLQLVANRARAAAVSERMRPTHRKESFVRSRIAIVLMLVFGFALSGAGAGLAVSGAGGDATLSQEAQYGEQEQAPALKPGSGVKGEVETSAPAATQVTRQLGAESNETQLPFTGFAAIPILLLGVFLLASGAVLNRSSRRSDG